MSQLRGAEELQHPLTKERLGHAPYPGQNHGKELCHRSRENHSMLSMRSRDRPSCLAFRIMRILFQFVRFQDEIGQNDADGERVARQDTLYLMPSDLLQDTPGSTSDAMYCPKPATPEEPTGG